jgi:ABC-type bacteriocin/lantibiotic exporter with double-glycine peptidase domain
LFGPEGTYTSIKESSDKYQVVGWLETYSLAVSQNRALDDPREPIDQIDQHLASYLKNRNKHFSILKRFYYTSIAFRMLVTGGLLILGTSLVVSREMSLGQFVASELVIVLVTAAVDKLISSFDTIFDMLASIEKIGMVTDLPIETDTPTHA